MTDDKKRIAAFAAAAFYLAGGIVAFGHSAAAGERTRQAEYAACLQDKAAGQVTYCWPNDVQPVAGGILAGMFWPLYLSREAFSHDR